MRPTLTKAGFDQLMSSLYGGGLAVYGSKENDVWVLAHFINELIDIARDEEDGAGYVVDRLKEIS